jgi:hypothetical protein
LVGRAARTRSLSSGAWLLAAQVALDDVAGREAQTRQLIETCCRQDAMLAELRHASSNLALEQSRCGSMQQQRDEAEEGRLRVQEQLASAIERLDLAEGRKREIEDALAQAKAKLSSIAAWESKVSIARRRPRRRARHPARPIHEAASTLRLLLSRGCSHPEAARARGCAVSRGGGHACEAPRAAGHGQSGGARDE